MTSKQKWVKFAFTARRIDMAQAILQAAIAAMATNRKVASSPAEIAFYDRQTPTFEALADLLTAVRATLHGERATRTIKLTEEQYFILSGSLANRNLQEMLAIQVLPVGAEREARLAAYDEWAAWLTDLQAKDPRKFDTSQDAAEEDDEDTESDDGPPAGACAVCRPLPASRTERDAACL